MTAPTKKSNTTNPYPVDSTTRTCCGGIGSHTAECTLPPVNLDPPNPAIARWEALAERPFEIRHDGDASLILGDQHPRPEWSDPDFDIVGRSHLSSGYKSQPVRVRASHAFGVNHDDEVWQPACAFVHATLWGNSHESITVTLSRIGDGGKWNNTAMSFQPHEAQELIEVLQAALALLGREDSDSCGACQGSKTVYMANGKWKYPVPCPDCDPAGFEAAEVDGDHFMIGGAK